jgi:serine/threonine-protein kinase
VAPGSDVAVSSKSLEPQPDGTFLGIETTTVLTNECGAEGQVFQVPYIATRVGDVPAGIAVSDPAAVPAPFTLSAPGPPNADTILKGTYRLEFTIADPNVGDESEDQPAEVGQPQVRVWAIQSACTPKQCVATAATLAGDNNDEPTGGASVLRFADGRWQNTSSLLAPQPCGAGVGEDSETLSLWLEVQSDGSLRGSATRTVLTNECGAQGRVSTMSIVATRIGDVPPGAVLADPALFE